MPTNIISTHNKIQALYNSNTCSVNVYENNTKTPSVLSIQKGHLHVARTLLRNKTTSLAKNGDFEFVYSNIPLQNSYDSSLHLTQNAKEVARVEIGPSSCIVKTTDSSIIVEGMAAIALQLQKKMAGIPEIQLAHRANIKGISQTTFEAYNNKFLAKKKDLHPKDFSSEEIRGLLKLCSSENSVDHTLTKYKTLFHFNSNIMSRLLSNNLHYNLSEGRGLILNAALAYNTTDTFGIGQYYFINAKTLETAPLVQTITPSAAKATCNLNLFISGQRVKVPVFTADDSTFHALEATYGEADKSKPLLYFFSKNKIPVLFDLPCSRKIYEAVSAHWQGDSTTPDPTSLDGTVSSAIKAYRMGKLLHENQERSSTLSFQEFKKNWLVVASAHSNPEVKLQLQQFASSLNIDGTHCYPYYCT